MTNKELKEFIRECGCAPCRALTALIEDAGANLLISTIRTGRMCELAVVAAAGLDGATQLQVVQGRRAYAKHLGVQMEGNTQNSPTPDHITWACMPPAPGDGNKPRIDLGRATPIARDGRFFVLLDDAPIGAPPAPRPRLLQGSEDQGAERINGIEIAWEDGIEQIPLDLRSLSKDSEINETVQYIDYPESGCRQKYDYETTSTIVALDESSFEVRIHYSHANNPHIPVDESWWGYTKIIVRKDDEAGFVEWHDDEPGRDRTFTFRKTQWHITTGDPEDPEDTAILKNNRLTPTQKMQHIKARRGQGVFRTRVLGKEPSCRVTGIKDPLHLRASHIQSWAESDDSDRLNGNNGLMLSPHIDHLFDRADISFENDGRLLVLNDRIEKLLKDWGVMSRPLARRFSPEQQHFLAKHRQRFFRKQEALTA